MELKEYQAAALDTFVRWWQELAKSKRQSEISVAALEMADVEIPEDVRNYPKAAWKKLSQEEYISRVDDAGRPIPHVCFKVPTGGGKTLLAAAVLEQLNRQTGLTLWIVPTKAIYAQTRKALWNKEHPYRQRLERASGGRVKLLEKDDVFTAAQTENYLCVLLLMLPAANRYRDREFLRMFRDSGRYPSFFPDSDDLPGNQKLRICHPDLEIVTDDSVGQDESVNQVADGLVQRSRPVKQSLFNVFKLLRPVVVLDEAHKAYGRQGGQREEFARSISRLDPSLVIELSATPHPGISNLLVDVGGAELEKEEMIKLPVQVVSYPNTEWQATLAQAHERLAQLAEEAELFDQEEGRYIRPIAVVRVERTGRGQQDGQHVHAEDVREHLIQYLGVSPDAVRVKSAERDELGHEDLMSRYSPVRWIITKSALMEGWDCPYAYLLVMLDNTTAQRAITQLVGRVMRQPYASRTGRAKLDQCYVHCWNSDVQTAVEQVKNGLEQEGLSGLGNKVIGERDPAMKRYTIKRRATYQGRELFLPKVLHRENGSWVELDYVRHILPEVRWNEIEALDLQPMQANAARQQMVSVGFGAPTFHGDHALYVDKTLKISWFVTRVQDIVPNPWQGVRIVQDMIAELRKQGETDETIHDKRGSLVFALREHIQKEVEKQSEDVFRDKLQRGEIRVDLRAGGGNFGVRESYEVNLPQDAEPLLGEEFRHLQLSLFEPVFKSQFDSDLERNFACYLDKQRAIQWWHRIAVRQGGYYLRGWKKERIWPDFVAMGRTTDGISCVLVFETKGEHLRGNPDTRYKQRVMETLQDAFNCGTMTVQDGIAKGVFRLVFKEEEFPQALADI